MGEKDNKICGVYAIINKVNGMIYIGSSCDTVARKKRHFMLLNCEKHCNNHLQYSWNKYGEINFEFKVIKKCKKGQLLQLEQKYIYEYNSTNST